MDIDAVLAAFKRGDLSGDEAAQKIRSLFFTDLGHTVLDTDRARRTGSAEVVFGEGKSPTQISDIIGTMTQAGTNVLVTRLDIENYEKLTGLPAAILRMPLHACESASASYHIVLPALQRALAANAA